ncbi:MAG: AEC family transporter [Firmicutes bacterium]|nr:AEC family transporter [Bacillota bacterium]
MNISSLLNLQCMMFLEMLVGYILCARKIIDVKDKAVVSKMVINVLLPCSIITAFDLETSAEMFEKMKTVLLISMAIQILCVIISHFCYNSCSREKKPIYQYGTVCSNAGLLGNAVIEHIYGSEGLLYGQFYLIPLRIVMWTIGISYFGEKSDLKSTIKKIFTHPCIVAIEIGLIQMIIGFSYPSFLNTTLISLGRCSTPMIMLFLGMVLAQTGFSKLITKDTVIYSIIRLLIIPAMVLLGCKLLQVDPFLTGISVALAAMPAGSTTAILAQQYNGDIEFASNCVVLSTLLSIVILPLWVLLI